MREDDTDYSSKTPESSAAEAPALDQPDQITWPELVDQCVHGDGSETEPVEPTPGTDPATGGLPADEIRPAGANLVSACRGARDGIHDLYLQYISDTLKRKGYSKQEIADYLKDAAITGDTYDDYPQTIANVAQHLLKRNDLTPAEVLMLQSIILAFALGSKVRTINKMPNRNADTETPEETS
ncbi:MAG: hypothetical protein AAF571_14670 [Verrucomicrobiota bacterium]